MKHTALLSAFTLLFVFLTAAKEKHHLPLPPVVFTAKTVFIDNQTGMAKLGDRAYEELQKWGRFQIVSDPKQADLIFLLTAQEHNAGYVTLAGRLEQWIPAGILTPTENQLTQHPSRLATRT